METEEILAAIQKAADTIATPNWAAIASIAISLLAVLVAGFVAWRQIEISRKQADISDKQNKIALFEKRYLIYDELSKITVFADSLDDLGGVTIKTMLVAISAILGYNITGDCTEPDISIAVELQRTRLLIRQAPFLFPEIDAKDINVLWTKFQQFYFELTLEVAKNPSLIANQFLPPSKFEFISASKHVSEKYLNSMINSLYFSEVVEPCSSPNPTAKTPSSNSSPPWATPTSMPPT